MTGNNPKLGLINVLYTKFGQILSIHSPDIEWKPNIPDSQNHAHPNREKNEMFSLTNNRQRPTYINARH